jgi:predicted GNAT family N-acyltransferase
MVSAPLTARIWAFMVEINRKSSEAESISAARYAKHKLDELDASRVAKHLVMFQPSAAVVEDLMAKARLSIPGLAETSEVLRVLQYNPSCMMAVCRRSRFDPANPVGEGFIAILPLRQLGLQMLALGSFNATRPDLRLVANRDERPAGIYMWGVYGPGPLAAGMALFMEKISTPQFAGVHLYSRPNTEIGVRFNEVLGFRQGTVVDGIEAPNVWKFSRAGTSPLYDSYVPGAEAKEIGITVARTFEDIMRVAAIRNSVYIGEQECPYTEEYDGNDFSAVHLLAYVGDEPVGCLRLRFFADFAKFERMAIRKEYRKSRAAIQLARAGFKFCQKKGYRRVYGHIQERLVPFWSRFGFRVMENTRRFVFSDFEYIEIVADIERDPDAITVGNDPYVVIRPEGRWHVSGVLEKSASRLATNPSVTKK